MKKLPALLLVTLIMMSSAYAADTHPIYVSFGAGRVISGHGSTISNNSNTILYAPSQLGSSLFMLSNVSWQNSYTNGYDADVAVGTELTPHLRVEGEFSYQNTNRHISGSYDWTEVNTESNDVFTNQYGNIFSEQTVTVNLYSLLANLYYDFKISPTWIPYVGGGLGVAWMKSPNTATNSVLTINDQTAMSTQTVTTIGNTPSLSGTAFAAQIKAGLAYAFAPNFTIAAEYRLFGTSHFHSSGSNVDANPSIPGTAVFGIPGGSINGIVNNTFNIVLRYTF